MNFHSEQGFFYKIIFVFMLSLKNIEFEIFPKYLQYNSLGINVVGLHKSLFIG